jgi:hypothetical protein
LLIFCKVEVEKAERKRKVFQKLKKRDNSSYLPAGYCHHDYSCITTVSHIMGCRGHPDHAPGKEGSLGSLNLFPLNSHLMALCMRRKAGRS